MSPPQAPPPWKAAVERLGADCPWHWRDLVHLLLLLALAQLLRTRLPANIAWDVLAFQGAAIVGFLWLSRNKPHPFGTPVPLRTIAGQALRRWLAILPILWAAALAWNFLLTIAGHAPRFQESIGLFLASEDVLSRIAFVLFAVVLAPLAEEGLFRGLLQPLLIRRAGATAGLALTALGFAALHGDLGTFVPLAIFSVALSLAYARTGTLWVSIGMHALFNAANLALLLLLDRLGVV